MIARSVRRASSRALRISRPVSLSGSSRVAGDRTICRSTPRTEAAIALYVQCQALEQARNVPQPIAAPFEHFQLVVQPFDKATRLTADEVVRDQVEPPVEQFQERIEAAERTLLDPPSPQVDTSQPISLRACRVEDGAQLLT